MGHDLGHTPFGHIGERTLNEILLEGMKDHFSGIDENFKHNFQSVRVVDFLETRCIEYQGINLTLAVREGMLKHTKIITDSHVVKYKDVNFGYMNFSSSQSFTLEGQIVAISDEIAQCTHDMEDGVRSKILSFRDILDQTIIQEVIKARHIDLQKETGGTAYETRNLIIKNLVGYLIEDVVEESQKKIAKYIQLDGIPSFKNEKNCFQHKCIDFSVDKKILVNNLSKWLNKKIIDSEEINIADAKAKYIIRRIFKAFYDNPKELPDYVLRKYYIQKNSPDLQEKKIFERAEINVSDMKKDSIFIRAIADHIAGMTDQYAEREYAKLYIPDYI